MCVCFKVRLYFHVFVGLGWVQILKKIMGYVGLGLGSENRPTDNSDPDPVINGRGSCQGRGVIEKVMGGGRMGEGSTFSREGG